MRLCRFAVVWCIAAVTATAAQAPSLSRPAASPGVSPQVSILNIPPVPGAHAIWGATGQDARGHIWFGISTLYTPTPSAHLIEYDPAAKAMTDRGDVVGELKRAGVLKAGEHQAKIHSRIVQGPDGYLYFASMDEEGEREDGSKLPTWGGHLWRMRLSTNRWEHLAAVPEALIAVAGGGPYVYTLGYFGHVLYRFDTRSRAVRRLQIGSVDGHISRNFLVDYRGHVYVPRLRRGTAESRGRTGAPAGPGIQVSIVELDTSLREIAETPVESSSYLNGAKATESHGIVSFQEMSDRSIYFVTHTGVLFHLVPPTSSRPVAPETPARVEPVGWFNPRGTSYTASLFSPDRAHMLSGVSTAADGYEWAACDLTTSRCETSSLAVPAASKTPIYGSSTRDASGGHYVVGTTPTPGSPSGFGPLILRVQPASR